MDVITKDNEATDINMVQVRDENGEAITLAYVNTEIQVARAQLQAKKDTEDKYWEKRLKEMQDMKSEIEKSIKGVVLKETYDKLNE